MLPLPRVLQVAMDVAQGCHYLHRQKPMIIQRDLKSQNILLAAQGVARSPTLACASSSRTSRR